MPKFLLDYRLAEGARIEAVSSDLEGIEKKLLGDSASPASPASSARPPRFYLPVDPEPLSPNYGQLVVNVHDHRDVGALMGELEPWLKENFPGHGAAPALRRRSRSDVEVRGRISGPADASGDELRALAAKGAAILRQSPLTGTEQTNWQQRVLKFEPVFNDARARWAGVSREDVVRGIKQSLEGWTIGVFNQEDEALPIVLRVKQDEVPGSDVAALRGVQIGPPTASRPCPRPGHRRRRRPLGRSGHLAPRPQADHHPAGQPDPRRHLADLHGERGSPARGPGADLPPGYRMEWGGEHETSAKSQASLIPGIVPAMGLMLIIIVGLFNALRPAAIIMLTIPFAVVGMTAGLLATARRSASWRCSAP